MAEPKRTAAQEASDAAADPSEATRYAETMPMSAEGEEEYVPSFDYGTPEEVAAEGEEYVPSFEYGDRAPAE